MAYTHVNADKSGRLLSDEYADPLRQTSGVIVTKPLVKPGEEVVSVEDGICGVWWVGWSQCGTV